MSKSLGRDAAVAEQRAAERFADIRRTLIAYHEAVREGSAERDEISRKRREFVDRLGDYLRLQKALRRIRKKIVRQAATQ